MAGYSGTPLPTKLGIKEGARVALIGAPEGFAATLGDLPAGAEFQDSPASSLDVMVCFVRRTPEVEAAFLELKPRLAWTGGLWLAWRKNKPGAPATLSENVIREIGIAAGLVDNKVCAIDDDWSGLRFVWRVEDRPRGVRRGR